MQALSEDTNLPSFTTQTKTMLLDLKKELEEIRKKGYAISKEEFEIGICSVAVPIFDRDGGILAAINVAAPTSVLNPDMLESQVVPVICETAKALSGYAR